MLVLGVKLTLPCINKQHNALSQKALKIQFEAT